VRAGIIECVLKLHSDLGVVLQYKDQPASEGPLQDATCDGKAFVESYLAEKCGALIYVNGRPPGCMHSSFGVVVA
jgi:hypothetical protein